MEPPEKVSAFLHIVRETIQIIQESGFLDEHLDLWSSAINRNVSLYWSFKRNSFLSKYLRIHN